MDTQNTLAADDACYNALKARDARFDGHFFTGVTSTGIYCRPVCRVKTPKRENCRFFRFAAQAETAGFRPCLRCRPELAPSSPALAGGATPAWSSYDAATILARQAAALLDAPETWLDGAPSLAQLAERLGVSDRHVRRVFEAEFGVSPLQYLQTRRLLTAKQLLTDTDLAVTQVAHLAGFASLRRFNAAFAEHYGLNPTALRRSSGDSDKAPAKAGQGIAFRASYRPPYDVPAMLGFLHARSLKGVECLVEDGHGSRFGRTLRLTHAGKTYSGWFMGRFNEARHQVELQLADSLLDVLPLVTSRLRATLDLDADPLAINAVLDELFPQGSGLRVPGTMDGYELAVRAVLGQQITVAAARTLATRLVARFGEPIETPYPELTHLFPAPQVLAAASGDALGQLGIVKQRQAAIVAIARAVDQGRLQLVSGANLQNTLAQLKELPGIGDWTAQYIAMRALRWPDAFPAGDVALHKALGVQGMKNAAKEAEARSHSYKPWRSYAVIRAWATLSATSTSDK